MFSLYIQPAANFLPPKRTASVSTTESTRILPAEQAVDEELQQQSDNHRDPIAFLYYSIVLTTLTVIVAIVIGVIQLLTMVLNAAQPTGKFWDGVETAGDYYDAIGGGICGLFIIFGIISVVVYKPWRRWIMKRYGRESVSDDEEGGAGGGGGAGAGEDTYHDDLLSGTGGEEIGDQRATVGKGAATAHVAERPAQPGSQGIFLE